METKEGILPSYSEEVSILLNILKILGIKPWAYIANRINFYAVQPIAYKYLKGIPTLKVLSIVSYSETAHSNGAIEAKFFHKPYNTFSNLEDAII